MKFPLSPRARSSSAGVLGKDWDKGKLDGDGDFNDGWSHTTTAICFQTLNVARAGTFLL